MNDIDFSKHCTWIQCFTLKKCQVIFKNPTLIFEKIVTAIFRFCTHDIPQFQYRGWRLGGWYNVCCLSPWSVRLRRNSMDRIWVSSDDLGYCCWGSEVDPWFPVDICGWQINKLHTKNVLHMVRTMHQLRKMQSQKLVN